MQEVCITATFQRWGSREKTDGSCGIAVISKTASSAAAPEPGTGVIVPVPKGELFLPREGQRVVANRETGWTRRRRRSWRVNVTRRSPSRYNTLLALRTTDANRRRGYGAGDGKCGCSSAQSGGQCACNMSALPTPLVKRRLADAGQVGRKYRDC